jgi:hypothetical protein
MDKRTAQTHKYKQRSSVQGVSFGAKRGYSFHFEFYSYTVHSTLKIISHRTNN